MQTTNINLKGVTRVPDDTACENGDLAIAVNLAADGDGLKMLEKPQRIADEVVANVNGQDVYTAGGLRLNANEIVLCVHQNDGYKHYITKYTYTEDETEYTKLCWWGSETHTTTEGGQSVTKTAWRRHIIGDTNATQATVMGNTIITQGTVVEYWLWDQTLNDNAGGYKALGQRPPRVDICFGLDSSMTCYPAFQSDPIELWSWWYASDVPLPFVSWSEDVHAYRSRMPNGTALKPKSKYEDMEDSTAETIWEITTGAFPNLWDFSLEYAVGRSNESESKINECVEYLTNSSLAWINKFITKKATDEGKFVFPFFVRYCYEMYDGSQILVSDPVLLIPSTHAPQFVILDKVKNEAHSSSAGWLRLAGFDYNDVKDGDDITGFTEKEHAKTAMWIKGRIFGVISRLKYQMKFVTGNYASWKDLIKSVGVYVSPPIYTYDQAGKVYGWKEVTDEWAGHFSEGNFSTLADGIQTFNDLFNEEAVIDSDNDYNQSEYVDNANHFVLKIPEHSNEDIRKAVLETSQYFKIAEFDYDELVDRYTDNPSDTTYDYVPIDENVLNVLTNRQQLIEDFTNGDDLSANVQYIYNRRLNIADVTRTLRPPLDPALQVPIINGAVTNTANETVEIADEGRQIVSVTGTLPIVDGHTEPLWLFYPNKKARTMYLEWLPTNKDYKYKLTEHNTLNGAYFLSAKLWTPQTTYTDDANVSLFTDTIPTATDGKITYEGEVWTSNVENPFVFQAANVNQVGDGVIKALRAAVAPLAEDQHGYAPMYVFTSQGVWAMTFSKDGTPAAIDHICGDIITDGTEPLSISQSCLMMSGRGLLELHGRTVRNLSAKIDGKFAVADISNYQHMSSITSQLTGANFWFASQLSNPLRGQACKMSYDYKHQRVYVWLDGGGGWVLNLRTGLWTHTVEYCLQTFNAYPSCEFVFYDTYDTGSSFVQQIVIGTLDNDTNYSTAMMMTRPIKFGEWQQKLREVAVRGFINPDLGDVYNSSGVWTGSEAQVWTALHGSRNWHSYGLVADSMCDRLTRLGGSGYRSHVVTVILRDPSATVDRLVISHDTEQGDRLR